MNSILKEFEEIDTRTLVDKVEARLVQLLKEKKLKVGDSIPKEVELAETLGVSRTVVREAMLRLRMMGMIESKKKRGAVITQPDLFAVFAKGMYPHIMSEDSLKDIYELRLMLEVGMADSLVRRVTDKDLEQLYEIAREEPQGTSNGLFNISFEVKFHGKLYEISGNETLQKFQHMLLPVFDFVHGSDLLEDYNQNSEFVNHFHLVELLKQRDAEVFRTGMRKHLDSHFRRMNSLMFRKKTDKRKI